jgi:hypothetical protein
MRLPSARHTRRDLVLSTIDGMACSVIVGCGETCLPAFAVAVGLGPVAAGMASLAAWMMWMAALVPRRVRAAFFTQRTRLSLVGIISGLFLFVRA